MISTLNSVQYQLPLTPPTPRDEQPPTDPEPPKEGIDFSTIDCPYKAVLMPSVNPAVLATVLAGMLASSMTGAPASAALQLAFNDTTGSLTYSFNPTDPNALVTASGQLGETAYHESWSVNPDTGAVTITGLVGNCSQELTLTQDEKEEAVYIRGHVGDIAVDQKLFVVQSENESRNRVVVDGTLGGRPFHQEIGGGDTESGHQLTVSGYLNGNDVQQTISTVETETGLDTSSTGDLAGTAFSLQGSLVLAQR